MKLPTQTLLTQIFKDVGVVKGPSPHNLEALSVGEFSLVTDPAILTKEESEAHAGLTVVKGVAKNVPEAVLKSISPHDGEDFYTAISRLVKSCRLALMAETDNQDTYWWYPVKIFGDYVLMGDIWSDPLDMVGSDDVAYYKCHYEQSADGSFNVSKVTGTKLQIVDVEIQKVEPTSKNADPPAEVAPEADPTPPVAEVEPVVEAVEASEPPPVVEPEVVVAEKNEPAPEPEAPAEPEVQATSKVDVAALVKNLAGQHFTMKIAADGSMTVDVGEFADSIITKLEPASLVKDPEVETLKAANEQLKRQLDEKRIQQAKVEGSDPTGNPILKSTEIEKSDPPANAAWAAIMAAANQQTRTN